MNQSADRNLLFGILALQLDFIDREQLISAMNAWVLTKSKPLGEVLVAQHALDEENHSLLGALVKKHLAMHGDDAEKSLAAVSTVESVRQELKRVADSDVEASLQLVSVMRELDPNRTVIGETPHDHADPFQTNVSTSSRTAVEAGSRFRVVRPHARGGLGVVSVAFDEELKREVALKEIHLRYAHDEISRTRFLMEAEITGRLEHPGIVPVYGLGHYGDGRPYYAMRFIRGDSLKDAISAFHGAAKVAGNASADSLLTERNLQFRKLLARFIDICNAMEYAHSRGILHRDLKPANVMLGTFGETLVVDWGLAKPMGQPESGTHPDRSMIIPASGSSSSTLPGSAIGTPQYMSPEQAHGRLDQLGWTSDIYSLGATLYHLLTGRAPMEGPNLSTVIEHVKSGQFARPRAVAPSVPAPLEAICLKAMALRPEDRYATSRALADDIEHWLADEPVSAMPETRRQKASRWLRRHRAWAQAAVAVLVLVSLVSVCAATLIDGARAKEKEARIQKEAALKDEQAANEQARAMLKESRQSIDAWQVGVYDLLKNYPNMQVVLERLLEQAAPNLAKLAEVDGKSNDLKAESARAKIRLGDVRRLLGQIEKSRDAYASAEQVFSDLSQATDDPQFVLELAGCRARLGAVKSFLGNNEEAGADFAKALEALVILIEKHPQNAEFRRGKAAALVDWSILLKQTGHLDLAEKKSREAVSLYGELARQQGDAKSHSDLAVARSTLGDVLAELDRAMDSLTLFQQALVACDEAVVEAADDPQILERRAATRVLYANALRTVGRQKDESEAYVSAIADYNLLLKALPDVPAYRENRGLVRSDLAQILQESGRNRDAKEELLTALDEFTGLFRELPSLPRYHEERAVTLSTLGRVLMELDENDDADVAFREALKLYDNLVTTLENPKYRARRGISRSALARLLAKRGALPAATEMYRNAVEDFETAQKANPDSALDRDGHAACLENFGDLLWDSGEQDEARKLYQESLKLRESLTGDPEYLCRLSTLLSNCRDPKLRAPARALQFAEKANKLSPENAATWSAVGIAQFQSAAWEAAGAAFEKASALRTGDRSADLFWLAMTRFRKGDADGAKSAFELGQTSLKSHRPGAPEMIRLQNEAAELLDIKP